MSKEERNKRLAVEYNEAFKTWNPDLYLKYVAPDASFHVAHDVWPGHEGFKRATEIAAKMYPNGISTETRSLVAEGDEVVLRLIARADNYYGSGEKYENYYVLFFHFTEDGMIDMHDEYLDTAYAAQLGSRAGQQWHL